MTKRSFLNIFAITGLLSLWFAFFIWGFIGAAILSLLFPIIAFFVAICMGATKIDEPFTLIRVGGLLIGWSVAMKAADRYAMETTISMAIIPILGFYLLAWCREYRRQDKETEK